MIWKDNYKFGFIGVLPLYALELLANWVWSYLKRIKSSQLFVQNLFGRLMNEHGIASSSTDDSNGLEIFDRNEANVFAEPQIVLGIVKKTCCEHFDFVK